MATNKLTHELFLERVNKLYGDTIEILSEYKGTEYNVDFVYKCKHGEQKVTTKANNLIGHNKKRCYCFRCRYPNRDKIYVGATFNYWTVIDDSYSNNVCRCRCKCGEEKEVDNYSLIIGESTSCGCYKKSDEFLKKMGDSHKKYNDYVINDKYVIMYTTKNEPFLVDIEDFGKVKNICWSKNGAGYLTGNAGDNRTVMLHRYIMDCPDDMDVDHKHGSSTKFDNRRSNLRIGTKAENMRNTQKPITNTSGYKGVYWNKSRQLWVAQIACGINSKNGKKKCYYLGSYKNIEDAIAARKAGEEKYFGEWSYDKSRELSNEGEMV